MTKTSPNQNQDLTHFWVTFVGGVTTAKAKEKASALAEPGSPAAPSVQKPRPESLPTNPVTSAFTGLMPGMAWLKVKKVPCKCQEVYSRSHQRPKLQVLV